MKSIDRRRNTGMSLREFCQEHGFDASNFSKMERGLLPPPPTREKLEEYLSALGVESFSDDWFTLMDAAAVARHELPHYIRSDEEVMDLLPVLFREAREEAGISKERLRAMIEFLRST